MYLSFSEMPDTARVWVFQSTDFLLFEKVERISARLMNFLESWQAHGKDLNGAFTIKYDRFIVVALDEASYRATGCSIDKLTHQVQALESELDISLLDRAQIAYRDDNGMISTLHMNEFREALESGEFEADTTVFNNMVQTKIEFEEQWEIPLRESWMKQWLPIG